MPVRPHQVNQSPTQHLNSLLISLNSAACHKPAPRLPACRAAVTTAGSPQERTLLWLYANTICNQGNVHSQDAFDGACQAYSQLQGVPPLSGFTVPIDYFCAAPGSATPAIPATGLQAPAPIPAAGQQLPVAVPSAGQQAPAPIPAVGQGAHGAIPAAGQQVGAGDGAEEPATIFSRGIAESVPGYWPELGTPRYWMDLAAFRRVHPVPRETLLYLAEVVGRMMDDE